MSRFATLAVILSRNYIRIPKSFTGRTLTLDEARTDRPNGTLGAIHKQSGSSELAGSTEWRYVSPECKLA
jgi:hypothetical protein